ncbi:hypothetical protein CJI59_36715 [Streptomyces sp. Alain-F2R5]|nr:hypothetical protein CJI59_36715 [Streptomyces sp. Alain-F2R5]
MFITLDRFVERLPFLALGRRGVDQSLIAAAQKAKSFRCTSRNLDQSLKFIDRLQIVAGLSGGERADFPDLRFVRKHLWETLDEGEYDSPIRGRLHAVAQ